MAREGESAMATLLSRIAAHPFFEGMRFKHLEVLSESAMQTRFTAGQIVFRRGDPANRFYLLESGRVAVEVERKDREPQRIQTLGAGQELGWSWILPPHFELFAARALEPTNAIFFYGTRLRTQCESEHELGYELMRHMAKVMMHRLEAFTRFVEQSPAATADDVGPLGTK